MRWLRFSKKSLLGRSLPPLFNQNTEWGSIMAFPPDLGKKLSAARHALGASIEDISQRTHIPENAIRHLEKGQFSEFPSAEYAAGFLAQYSDYLSLPAPTILILSIPAKIASAFLRARETNIAVLRRFPLPKTGHYPSPNPAISSGASCDHEINPKRNRKRLNCQ